MISDDDLLIEIVLIGLNAVGKAKCATWLSKT